MSVNSKRSIYVILVILFIGCLLATMLQSLIMGIIPEDTLVYNFFDNIYELGFIKFEDAESKQSFWIDLNKKNAKKISNNVISRINTLNDFCRKNKIDLINIDSKDNYIEPIINFFNSRIHR